MHLIRRPFQWPRRCAGAIQTASSNAACPGLLRKPLDATIRQLLAPYRPSGCQGNSKQKDDKKMYQKDWPFQWPRRCAGTIPRTLPNRGGLGLCWMPLNAAIVLVLRPIVAIGQAYLGFFQVFSSSTCTKRSQVNAKAPVFNRGITYQTKEKGLIRMSI
jgi:hypothetical protein